MTKSSVDHKVDHGVGRLLLGPDETVRRVERPSRSMRLPRYLVTLGLYGLWRKRDTAIVTDHRLILGKGLVSRRERSIPLARVRDATFFRHGLAGYAEILVEGRRGRELVRVGPLSPRRARGFASDLQRDL